MIQTVLTHLGEGRCAGCADATDHEFAPVELKTPGSSMRLCVPCSRDVLRQLADLLLLFGEVPRGQPLARVFSDWPTDEDGEL